MSGFIARLGKAWEKNDSLLCIGLDPEIERFPRQIAAEASPIFQFNKAVIDATHDLVCAYKPQFAHYAAYEAEDQLERTIEYVHRTYPGIPVILDGKLYLREQDNILCYDVRAKGPGSPLAHR